MTRRGFLKTGNYAITFKNLFKTFTFLLKVFRLSLIFFYFTAINCYFGHYQTLKGLLVLIALL